MFWDQEPFDIRCEWGSAGVTHLAPLSDVVIIVDVLSFSTCVDIAVSNGAVVYPYPSKDAGASHYAQENNALLASRERTTTNDYSLSPSSLLRLPAGTRLVLPSPNGSALSLATGQASTFAGCLRNARAVAEGAQQQGKRITVIAAGERWPDGSVRPAIEDLFGAGAIIQHLTGARSPEAIVAQRAFEDAQATLESYLQQCSSGRELIERGFQDDVGLAAALDVSVCAPILRAGAYMSYEP